MKPIRSGVIVPYSDREKARASGRKYRVEHREELKLSKHEHYMANREYYLAKALVNQTLPHAILNRSKRHSADPRKNMLRSARSRARKKGLPFNLTLEDIVIPERCPVLGTILVTGEGKPTKNSPTLDKFRPEFGHTKSNVSVISYRANAIKNDATLEELERIVEWMKRSTR